MAQCLQYAQSYTDTNGQNYEMYFTESVDLENCPSGTHAVIVEPTEYTNLVIQGELLNSIDAGLGLVDAGEISAVFGICFGIIVSISAIAYKVRVGKNLVKMA